MFKLFKDLTRPPERLDQPSTPKAPTPPTSAPSSLSYTARQRTRPLPDQSIGEQGKSGPPKAPVVEEVEETEEDAKKVVELLKGLETAEEMMGIVELFSQIISIKPREESLRAFRRHRGFSTIINTLGTKLAWRGEQDDEVAEVQRMEGIRLAFEVLAWAMQDRRSALFFEKEGGYMKLLPVLRTLAISQPKTPDMTASSSSDLSKHSQHKPDARILSYLLAHIFDNNYSILSIFDHSNSEPLGDRLGELKLRWGGALPLLWAYMWGLNTPTDSKKGKEKARDLFREVASGHRECLDADHGRIIETTFQFLLASVHNSASNLFILVNKLDLLSDFLLHRLYGPAKARTYSETFPARRDWVDRIDDQEADWEWKAPSPSLRTAYLALLRKLLETGVNQNITWRLFELVKTTEADRRKKDEPTHSETSTPTGTAPSTPTKKSRTPAEDVPLTAKPKRRPQLTLAPTAPLPVASMERLDTEILDLLRHAMRSRWPDMFVFRGGKGISEAGIELPDLGRAWPGAQKGFHFSTWIHISRLNRPFTLLHVSQSGREVFQLSILDNSQISIKSHAAGTATPTAEGGDEVVCSAPDALIPHQTWVHFAINSRKPKSADNAEARLFINGVRVGTMRIDYPTANPLAPVSARTASSPDAIKVNVGRRSTEVPLASEQSGQEGGGKEDENEIMLGRTLLLEETISEDLVLLLHHLGPRYHGNLQEAAGKFLTYEGATSINIYLSTLGQNAADKRLFTMPNTSAIVKAIRTGPAIPEEHILLSLSASDMLPSEETVVNAAVPHPWRARQLRHGLARLHGDIHAFSPCHLDDSVEAVGGGAVILKLIDMSQTSEELASTVGILRDMIKDSWRASEEMERIRGFELLAAILRPKMPLLVDIHCTKIILQMLGINMDKPESATVHNSVAYRALGVEFELWSHAPLGVASLYLEHFQYLLVDSKHRRFNLLRTFQKSAMIRKLLYALRSGLFDAAVVPVVVDTLKVALEARWSAEDSIKPVFSYLVTALCQNTRNIPPLEPPPSQAPAAYVLTMFAEVAQDATRLVKLNKAIALHRLLVVFISSNPAYYVVIPSLEMLERCLSTPGLESFQRSFETEGGFALLAQTLPGIWRDDIQSYVFRMMLGKDVSEDGKGNVKCPGLVSCVLAALDVLLQQAGDDDSSSSGRPPHSRTRSGTVTSIRSIAFSPIQPSATANAEGDDDRLQDLLSELAATYRSSHPFRRSLTSRKVEGILPSLTDFAAISGSSTRDSIVRPQREAAADFVQALLDLGKLGNTINSQLRLIQEQLQTPNPNAIARPLSASMVSSPMAINAASPSRPSSSYFSSSLSSRFGTTPPSSIPSSPTGSIRRRPSTEAGQTFNRARSIIERRAPLKRTLTNESVLEGGKDKNAAWKTIIIQTDSQKHSKMTLERKEYWNKLGEQDWPRLAQTLRTENALWPDDDAPVTWRLDGSEGPLRMRARLERVNAQPEVGMAKTQRKLRDAIPSVDELSSAVSRVNVAPWEDPFALALGQAAPIEEEDAISAMAPTKASEPADGAEDRADGDSFVEVEEEKDDKMRRIAKTLEAGDVVEEAHNIIRIVGVDACPGLLIIGKKNLYLIDGLVQTPNGEVIDAKDAPKDVLTVPSGTLVELDSSDQQSRRWSYNEIVESNKRMFLFRDVALELYFSDKRNFLIVFRDKRQRQGFMSRLLSKNDPRDAISKSVIGNFVLDTVARAIDKPEQQLEAMTRKWQSREISNFAYLQLLNQHANRTPNDVTQYPVFPWVLADYTSFNLDLEKETTFRNLALPMGALTAARQESAAERYSATEGVGEKPFHYGTHYSSSMIVCGYMIRASPFTEIFLALQGGNFDLADRLFSSIPRAWISASSENRGDVRELVPEFYYSPSFLINVNHHDFGKKQVTGDSVDDVVLPPWALDEPSLFIHRHREALESDYVSRHLPHWIDLVFGSKQRDPASYNCYHPLSYRGAVDLESIKDEGEKAASTAIIHNFGQTPEQIFKGPHPHRFISGKNTLPVGQRFGVAEGWQLLLRSILPITESTTPIDDLVEPLHGSEAKPAPRQKFRLDVPGIYVTVQFGFADKSLRVYYQDPTAAFPRLVHLTEGIDVRHAIFAAPHLLVTVSTDGVLTAWRMQIKNTGIRRGDVQLTREATLRGHTSKVTCLAASSAWSLLVSGTEDGNAIVWDTNRLRYTRMLQTTRSDPIKFCSVLESDGKIALVTARDIYLYSLNGHPIAHTSLATNLSAFNFTQTASDTTQPQEEFTGGLTFLNREFLKYGPLFVIGVGSQLALYRCVPGVQIFEDEEVKPWTLEEQGRLHRSEDHNGGDCTMVKFIGETLYAAFASKTGGNAKSALYQWSLPEGIARHVPEMVSGTCMTTSCGRHFGLLEPRRHCGGCGGAFCGTHAVHVENFQSRYCESCRAQLSRGAHLGLLAQRRDSVISASASSRRGSLAVGSPSTSRPGSRRGSFLGGVPPHLSGMYKTPHGPSGLGSRPGSRRGSVSKSGQGSGSGTAPGTPILH